MPPTLEKRFPDLSHLGTSGIYKILFDDKYFYIGSSKNLYSRIRYWPSKMGSQFLGNNHKMRSLLHTFHKSEAIILEICDPSILKERETFYIEEYWDDEICLNVEKSGYNCKGTKKLVCNIHPSSLGTPPLPPAPELKPLSILKTKGEWSVIMNKIDKMGKKDLSVFIRSEVRKLTNEFSLSPDKIIHASGDKISKRPYIPIDSYEKLEMISKKMKIPVSGVVDRLIIQPLLMNLP